MQKQILMVEDNMLNREILKEILSDAYSVLEAENGQEALDVLREHADDIAVILLDVMMPVMDGFTFLDRIKADDRLSLIPVIIMTQSDSEADEVAALAHGATDFVPKPYRPQVILHRVASIIKLRETAAMVNLFQYDRLTGLFSREFFYEKVRERLREDPEGEYSIVCSNIVNFKLYNDSFGVAEGDRLLREAADAMRRAVEPSGICGRFGADRFICLQESGKEARDRAVFDSDQAESGRSCNVVMKWGVYEITDRSVPVEQMCDRANLAVDSIKDQYNCHFAVYDDVLRGKLLREQAITEAMETALNEGQFVVYYQPKYSLNNDCLAGAEALVRWVHPELGFLSPGEFIPLFEKNGFITRLDRYVWENVCATLRLWREKGYPQLSVSVNVSRADVYHTDLADTLLEIIRKYGVEPAQLHLELTESAYTENPAQILSTVEHLRELGFIIEMDDFGSGYSSLNMLNQMKLDILKLDMKFIRSETSKPMEQGILRFIVGLARWLNLSVVAEGVETREQLERLREIGCDYVQGYFFARPMPAEEFEKLLQAQPPKYPKPSDAAPQAKTDLVKLLVADEDAEYRGKVRELFEGHYEVLEAATAQEGIACIRESGQASVFAVILSATLPEKGALALVKAIRQDPACWRIPILTTMPYGESCEEYLQELDTDDFLCKHHPLKDLRRRVFQMMRMDAHHVREQLLIDEAGRDYLTGLLNRRGFFAALDALRQEDLPLAMYLFDLDDLKKVNDQFSHNKGDEMLCFFGDLLRRQTRDGDILCRYGGDEFVVVLRRIASLDSILQKGETICREFQEFPLPDGLQAACSGGIALCGTDERPSAELIERADAALYRAKKKHKGSCCLWEQ